MAARLRFGAKKMTSTAPGFAACLSRFARVAVLALVLLCLAGSIAECGELSDSTRDLMKEFAFMESHAYLGEHDYAQAEVRSGDEAHEIFCSCEHNGNEGIKKLCPSVTTQCKNSFCKPLCLRMAWRPVVEVHCERAPTWGWCPKFKAQVEEARKAVTTQFQAFTCLNMHFCNESRAIFDWIDNHSFGNRYPDHHLPIESCTHKEATADQRQLLCKACERVIDVRIERGECMPQFKTLHPGSLQERCLYLADLIGQQRDQIEADFRKRVCPCLGCCGDGHCMYKNHEAEWMNTLVDKVTEHVTAQLEVEGWTTFDRLHDYTQNKKKQEKDEQSQATEPHKEAAADRDL